MSMAAKPLYPVPHRTATIGMLLFLAALGMLFGSSLLAYFIIRIGGANSPQGRVLHLPLMLWLSTAVMIASSFTIHRALAAIRTERRSAFRAHLLFTLSLAVTFIAIQAPALVQLLRDHWQLQAVGVRLYGVLFFLILLHALHVVGGLVGLVRIIIGAYRGRFDHEHHVAVRNTAWYWHFLDAVWVIMFLSMWAVG